MRDLYWPDTRQYLSDFLKLWDVRQEDYVFCLVSDGLIMLAQENSPCFVDKGKGGHQPGGNTMSII